MIAAGAVIIRTLSTVGWTLLNAQLAPFATDSLAQVVEGFGHAGGILYYSNNTSTHGDELWKTDGTEAGTVMVKAFDRDTNAANNLSNFIEFKNKMYFSAFGSAT